MKKLFALVCLPVLLSHTAPAATILADWTFETTSNLITGTSASIGPIAADVGIGSASGVHASSSTVWSHPAGNGSPSSFSVNTWTTGDYFQFQSSTLGFSGISVQYDQTGSSTGPRDFTFSYSLNGTSFTTVGSTYNVLVNGAPNPAWSATGVDSSAYTLSYDLSGITALNNAANVYFRITDADTTSIGGGTVAAGGTDRIDNFIVSVPEPTVTAMAAIGLISFVGWKRMRRHA